MLRILMLSGIFSLAIQYVSSEIVPITLDIVNTVLDPDGFNRSVIVANGTYPGPLIRANKGDHLRVTVNNKLTDSTMRRSTSINFDGIHFNSSDSFFEGTPGVTTCPLGPNTSFIYDVPLLNGQTGTHWYHSQLSVQYVDGLRGPLIIYDPDDPLKNLYDVDDESTIIQLGDWWHNTSVTLLNDYMFVHPGIVPVPDCGTVNGVGRFKTGPEIPFSITEVMQGKRYRLRVINEAVRDMFTFSIDNHNLTVIELDGEEHVPKTVEQIDIYAGQRYSFILNANQRVDSYWIRAPLVGGSLSSNLNLDPTLSKGILRYSGAPKVDPVTSVQTNPLLFNEADMIPFNAPGKLGNGPADVNITLVIVPTVGQATWNVNNVSYISPEVPTLIKVLTHNATDVADFDVTENTFILPRDAVVDILFPPIDTNGAHPIHLHGHDFELVKSATGNTTNLKNPPRRDTALATTSGTTLRFKADTPGPWFLHCHIFWHMQAGLATVSLTDPEGIRQEVHPNTAWGALCPAYAALPKELQ